MKSDSVPDSPSSQDETDAVALRKIANGDRLAFQEVFDRYENLLFATILHVLNDRPDTEEVLQEVGFSIWRKAHQFNESKGRPVTWLTSMARNRAIDRLRSKQRQSKLKSAYSVETDALPRGNSGISGPDAAQRRDTCLSVRSAVLKLNDLQREVIEKAYFEGLTQKEIARELGQPVGTVKARIRRALAKLRETMHPN